MENYDRFLDHNDKLHLRILISWLWEECRSSGGDGDALWYSEKYSVEDLLPLVQEVSENSKWNISCDGKTILWTHEQEWVEITNNKELFDNSPSWIQVKIRY